MLGQIKTRLESISSEAGKLAKHRQLSEAILSLVDDGVLKPGERLPTETVLAQSLPFSLGTIQKAMRNLSELGVVSRLAGRGTFIVEKTGEIFDLWQFRFADQDRNSVFPVFSSVSKLDRVGRNGSWSKFLGDEDSYVRIEREINVDNRFKILSSFYLSNEKFGSIIERDPEELEGVHLHAVIRREFDVRTERTKNRVMCSTIPDLVCLRLKLPSAARGLLCQILGFANRDQPLSFQEIYVPADADPIEFRELRPTT